MRQQRILKSVGLVVSFLLLASLITWPAFANGNFKTSFDAMVHLTRWESIYQALKSGQLPPLVNLIGFRQDGAAFTAMYPWLTSLIFILPRFLVGPLAALFIGFVVLNFLTMVNAYLLSRQLTNQLSLRLIGVLVYEFGAYHLLDLYSRVDIGESFAYAFYPLVLLGILRIWHRQGKGGLILGVGMALMLNSHLLTSVYATVIMIIVELVRLLMQRVNWFEIKQFLLAAGITILGSCYTLVNLIYFILQNQLSVPGKTITNVKISLGLIDTIRDQIPNQSSEFNLGLLMFAILVGLIVISIFYRGPWRKWIWTGFGIYVFTFLPVDHVPGLVQALYKMQFTGRLYGLVDLLIMAALVMFLQQLNWSIRKKWLLAGVVAVLMIVGGVRTSYLYHQKPLDDVNQFRIHSNHQYRQLVYNLSHSYNYTLESAGEIETGYQVVEQNATKEVIEVQRSQAGRQKFNLSIFKGVYYRVLVNGKSVKVPVGQNLTGNLKSGLNRITITTKAPWWNYLTLAITLITWLVLLIIIFY